ncbi:MAG: thymidine kinase [Rhodobacteraceae bacterium]|nr:thymidine kinase [Paracoccaceae bacterium]
MVKVVTLFLIFMLVMGMFGKLRMPKLPKLRRRDKVQASTKCPKCGRYNLTGKTCDCDK